MASILVVGSGVVGRATGKGLATKGHRVIFVDTDANAIRALRHEGFEAYHNNEYPRVDAEISMFCLPTPAAGDGSTRLDFVTSAVIEYAQRLKQSRPRAFNIVVVRSTVPPRTTRNVILPLLEKHSGMKAGYDFGLCMQPEFLRAKFCEEDFLRPWAIVIGALDDRSADPLARIYADFESEIFRVDLETAEFVKYVGNCLNATKISFSNEMWLLGQRIGVDANTALRIVAKSMERNPTYGTVGGWPYGGNCLPKDTRGLLAYVKKLGVFMPLLSAVVAVNSQLEQQVARARQTPLVAARRQNSTALTA